LYALSLKESQREDLNGTHTKKDGRIKRRRIKRSGDEGDNGIGYEEGRQNKQGDSRRKQEEPEEDKRGKVAKQEHNDKTPRPFENTETLP
jgi:hypothetical protein